MLSLQLRLRYGGRRLASFGEPLLQLRLLHATRASHEGIEAGEWKESKTYKKHRGMGSDVDKIDRCWIKLHWYLSNVRANNTDSVFEIVTPFE